MAQIGRWRCEFRKCGFDKNWATLDEIKNKTYLPPCMNCGVGTEPVTPLKVTDNWLECLPITGLALRLPNGSPGEGWMDGDTNVFSRADYIKKYNVDPERFWYFTHPNYPRPADLQPKPLPSELSDNPQKPPKKTEEKLIDDAVSALNAMRTSKKIEELVYINEIRYLEKLRQWRTLDLITDEDVKSQIDRTMPVNK